MPKGSDNVVEEVKAVKKNRTTRGFSQLDRGLGASKFVTVLYKLRTRYYETNGNKR